MYINALECIIPALFVLVAIKPAFPRIGNTLHSPVDKARTSSETMSNIELSSPASGLLECSVGVVTRLVTISSTRSIIQTDITYLQ